MGVYIKGMEMPKDGHWGTVSIPFYIHGDGSVSDSKGHIIGSAVHIPPHGDLVDRDVLKKQGYFFPCAIGTECAIPLRALREAPTVIQAEPCNNLSKPCKEGEA